MSKRNNLKPIAIAFGAALAAGVTSIPTANADANPFGMTELSSGYQVAGKEGVWRGQMRRKQETASPGNGQERRREMRRRQVRREVTPQ